jgi:hypothetical protein
MTTPPDADMNAWMRDQLAQQHNRQGGAGLAEALTGAPAPADADTPPADAPPRAVGSADVGNYPAPPPPFDMNAWIRDAIDRRY